MLRGDGSAIRQSVTSIAFPCLHITASPLTRLDSMVCQFRSCETRHGYLSIRFGYGIPVKAIYRVMDNPLEVLYIRSLRIASLLLRTKLSAHTTLRSKIPVDNSHVVSQGTSEGHQVARDQRHPRCSRECRHGARVPNFTSRTMSHEYTKPPSAYSPTSDTEPSGRTN